MFSVDNSRTDLRAQWAVALNLWSLLPLFKVVHSSHFFRSVYSVYFTVIITLNIRGTSPMYFGTSLLPSEEKCARFKAYCL